MQKNLFVAVLEMQGFVVGRANATSGLHRYDGETAWTHIGWETTRCNGIGLDPHRPEVRFLACGNGVFRTRDGGRTWRVTTGWEITDVMDISVDPHAAGRIFAGSAYGIWRSDDDGDTWHRAMEGIAVPRSSYIGLIEADRSQPGRVLAAGAGGLFRSTSGADAWESVGPTGVDVRDLRQSAADPRCWLAATDGDGLLISRDSGSTWSFLGSTEMKGVPLYSVALHPGDPRRMAAGGYLTGVWVSADGGRTWAPFGSGLPVPTLHGLAFGEDDRLWAGTVGRGVFVTDGPSAEWRADDQSAEWRSDDMSAEWRYVGLDGGTIVDMVFDGGSA